MNNMLYHCVATNGISPDATSNAATLTVTPNAATVAAQQLKDQLQNPAITTVTITGAIDLSLVGGATVATGKTIVGADSFATISGALTIPPDATDIVILGLNFTNASLTINGSTDVEVSHCTFTDAPVAITGASDNIAFSWNEFTTIGAGSAMFINVTGATSGIGILLHHNLWGAGLKSDMPSVTNARVLMYNNYFTATGNTTATIAGLGAQILSARNIYEGTNNPLAKQSTGKLRALDNSIIPLVDTTVIGGDTVFVPAYTHLMHPVAAIAALVTAHAGNTAGSNSDHPSANVPNATASITTTLPGATTATASVTASSAFTLTASATEFAPAAYQWYLNNFPIAGATAATYTVASASATTHAGAYSVTLTTPAPAGELVTSAAFTITVGASTAPSFTTHPLNQTVPYGRHAIFTVAASGNPAPTLQWQFSTNNGATWTNLPNATTTTLVRTEVTTTMNGFQYRCVATNSAGSVPSNPATLTVTLTNTDDSGGGAPSLLWLATAAAMLALRKKAK